MNNIRIPILIALMLFLLASLPVAFAQDEPTPEQPPIVIEVPAEETPEPTFAERATDILTLIAYGIGLAGLGAILWQVNGFLSDSRENLKTRYIKADAALVSFGQGSTGQYLHQQAERLYEAVDEPTDALVGQLTGTLNRLVRRQILKPDLASAFLREVAGAAVELTDGVALETKQPRG